MADWTPGELTSTKCKLWCRGSDSGTITHVSNVVSKWDDQSGNSNHLAQTTESAKPTTGTHSINGKNAIRFADGTEHMDCDADSTKADWQFLHESCSIYMAVQIDTVSSGLPPILTTRTSSVGLLYRARDSNRVHIFARDGSNQLFSDGSATGVGQGTDTIYELRHDSSLTNDAQQHVNFTSEINANYDNTPTTGTDPDKQFQIGGGAAFHVAEIVVVDGLLSTDDHERVQGYLAHEYALTAGLATDHPYKSSRPTTGEDITDSFTVGDTFSALVTASGALDESVDINDTVSAVASTVAALAESVVGSDSDAGQTTALGALSESVSNNDVVAAVTTAAAALVDAVSAGESWAADTNAVGALVESFAATETYAALSSATGNLSESISVSDAVTAVVGGAETGAIAETASLSETYLGAVVSLASLTDSASINDANVAVMRVLRGLSDSVTVNDIYSITKTFPVAISESINVNDVLTTTETIIGELSDTVLFSDLIAGLSVTKSTINESIGIADVWTTSAIPGYITGSISLVAALAMNVNITPSISGDITIN